MSWVRCCLVVAVAVEVGIVGRRHFALLLVDVLAQEQWRPLLVPEQIHLLEAPATVFQLAAEKVFGPKVVEGWAAPNQKDVIHLVETAPQLCLCTFAAVFPNLQDRPCCDGGRFPPA